MRLGVTLDHRAELLARLKTSVPLVPLYISDRLNKGLRPVEGALQRHVSFPRQLLPYLPRAALFQRLEVAVCRPSFLLRLPLLEFEQQLRVQRRSVYLALRRFLKTCALVVRCVLAVAELCLHVL